MAPIHTLSKAFRNFIETHNSMLSRSKREWFTHSIIWRIQDVERIHMWYSGASSVPEERFLRFYPH